MPYRQTENVVRRLAARRAAILARRRRGRGRRRNGRGPDRTGRRPRRDRRRHGLSLFPGQDRSRRRIGGGVFRARTGGALERAAKAAPGPLSALAAAITTFAARALASRRLAFALIAEPVEPEVDVARAPIGRRWSTRFNTAHPKCPGGRASPRAGRCARGRGAGRGADRGPGRLACARGSGRCGEGAGAGAGADTVCFARARRRRCPCPRSHRADGAATAGLRMRTRRGRSTCRSMLFGERLDFFADLQARPRKVLADRLAAAARCSARKASEMALNDIRFSGRAKPCPSSDRRRMSRPDGGRAWRARSGRIPVSCSARRWLRARSATAGKSGSLCRAASATGATRDPPRCARRRSCET